MHYLQKTVSTWYGVLPLDSLAQLAEFETKESVCKLADVAVIQRLQLEIEADRDVFSAFSHGVVCLEFTASTRMYEI